ncbi:MAG: hypothetical protein ACT4OX_04470 [Actinomycetota bacterium]
MAKIAVGFFSFTEVTDPAEHRSYNEWHALDHMPEQFPMNGMAAGNRWVSTPACMAARAAGGPPYESVHYITMYLMTEPVERTLRAFYQRGVELGRLGRFHKHRTSHLTGGWRVDAMAAAPRVLVSPEAVPYRPHRGVYVIVEPAAAAWDPSVLVDEPEVAGVWTFRKPVVVDGLPWQPGDRRVTVCWCDDDPLGAAPGIGARIGGAPEYAGPLLTITPGRWDWFD